MGAMYLDVCLIDGNADGSIRACVSGHNIYVYKIKRGELDKYHSEARLNQAGIYFLFGSDKGTDYLYVGQADQKANGTGVLDRVLQHKVIKETYWDTAFIMISQIDDIAATQLNYLEAKFWELATKSGRYTLKNTVKPSKGVNTVKLQTILQPYIDDVITILKLQGYDTFTQGPAAVQTGIPEFHLTQKGQAGQIDAFAEYVGSGMILKKGSLVSMLPTKSCPPGVSAKRKKYAYLIDAQGFLQQDIQFDSPSGAAAFAVYGAANGWVTWKDNKGKTLSEKVKGTNAG